MPSLTDAPVAVTGASGYLASWVVHHLLQAGATVHATVRDPSNAAKVGYLNKMAEELPGSLKLFAADLLKEGSFADAFEGCEVVMHTASPFVLGKVKDPQRELIDPALKGTRNALSQVNKTESVQRVVLTSSVAAIAGDNADCADRGGTLSETHWNESSSLDHNPYAYSKTLAEREAWKLAKAQDRWRLVVINPAFIMGPSLPPTRKSGASVTFMRQTIDGTFRQATFDQKNAWVDVRDVATAHLEAARRDDAEGRHVLCSRVETMLEAGRIIERALGSRVKVPLRAVPRWAAYVPAWINGFTSQYVKRNVGHDFRFDNTRSVERLGIEYRPLKQTLVDHATQILDG